MQCDGEYTCRIITYNSLTINMTIMSLNPQQQIINETLSPDMKNINIYSESSKEPVSHDWPQH